MRPLYVRALYSAIKAYGPMPYDQVIELCAYIANCHLAKIKADIKLYTQSVIETNYMAKGANNTIQVIDEMPDIVGDEHLPWDKYFKLIANS